MEATMNPSAIILSVILLSHLTAGNLRLIHSSRYDLCYCNDFPMTLPICGSDGRTYQNWCTYNCARFQYKAMHQTLLIAKHGSCTDNVDLNAPYEDSQNDSYWSSS